MVSLIFRAGAVGALGLLLLLSGTTARADASDLQSSGAVVVKPGARLKIIDGICTMNFVFADRRGREYVATAGHCPLADQPGEQIWRWGKGPVAYDANDRRIGRAVSAIFDENRNLDFGLIRLDPRVEADPQMEHFGGPTGIEGALTYGEPEVVNMYGHGQVFRDSVRERQLILANGFDDPELLWPLGVASPGDSGAPVSTDEDKALGILVGCCGGVTLLNQGLPAYGGNLNVVRLSYNLKYAEAELGLELDLMEARALSE